MKLNDYILNILSNLEFTNADFLAIGLDNNNTSLENKDVYKNLEYIKNQEIFLTDGQFDEVKFDQFYNAASQMYLEFSTVNAAVEVAKNLATSKYNIFAEPETRNVNPEFVIHKTLSNPFRLKSSVFGGNQLSELTLSIREIAQTLLHDHDNEGQWMDSPNDLGFFGEFLDTKVLATYDSDGTHIDSITGEEVAHKKGDYKYNENGTFYYEDLGDRDIYGKQVLSKWDVLTTDGSVWNEYDFMDSDDLEKDITGTLVKNVIKVAPAFIPGIAPWYIGARVGLNTIDLFTKVGKMVVGSDSPNLSALEGFVKSTNTTASDYSSSHMWSLENIINMGADVFLQLAEQRWLFEKLPNAIGGKDLSTLKARNAWQKKKVSDYIDDYKKNKPLYDDSGKLLADDAIIKAQAVSLTNRQLESILKDRYKLGEKISKAYMTGITSASAYEEAKATGASDLEATLFTLGFAAGEYGILNTRLGDWILPELHLEKARLRKVISTLHNQKPSLLAPKKEHVNWMSKVILAGKDWFKGSGIDEDSGKMLVKHSVANALGEGTEEVVEQAWLDMSKTLFNVGADIFNSDTSLRQTWRDADGKLNLMNTLNDYALNFVGGAIGGGLGNFLPSFREANKLSNMTDPKEAYKELLYHLREGKGETIKKIASSMQLGDPTKSTELLNDFTFKEGTKTDNLDLFAKNVFNLYIDRLQSLIDYERDIKNDHDISLDLVMKDVRFMSLLESNVLSSYLLDYNTAASELISAVDTLNASLILQKDNAKPTKEKEESIKKLEETVKEKREKVHEYTDGTKSKEFIKDALFEMEHGISDSTEPTNFIQYVLMRELSQNRSGDLINITSEDVEKYKKEWSELKFVYRDKIRDNRKLFDYYNKKVSKYIKNHVDDYLKDVKGFVNVAENILDIMLDALDNVEDVSSLESFFNNLYLNGFSELSSPNLSKKVLFATTMFEELSQTNPNYRSFIELLNNLNLLLKPKQESAAFLSTPMYQLNGLVVSLLDLFNSYSDDNIDLKDKYEKALDDKIPFNSSDILMLIRNILTSTFNNAGILSDVYDVLLKLPTIKHSSRAFLYKFFLEFVPFEHQEALTLILGNIPYTPILELIDNLLISLDDKSIKYSKLIEALELQAYTLSYNGTLSDFGFPEVTWELAIDHALDLHKILSSNFAAARTDYISPNFAFGYNSVVNMLEENDDLITFEESIFNILAQDLYKQVNDIKIYKKLIGNSANKMLTASYLVGAHKIKDLVDTYKLWFKPDYDDEDNSEIRKWKNAEDFINILTELSENKDLELLANYSGILNFDQKKLYKLLKYKLDKAIFNFILSNSNKTSEDFLNLFLRITNIGKLSDTISLFRNDQPSPYLSTYFSYLAAYGSLNIDEFNVEYKKLLNKYILSSEFVHTEAHYNLVFHAVAWESKKEVWDKIQDGFTAVQQKLVKDGNTEDSTRFSNKPDSKLNNASSLIYPNQFLLTGLSGTGKSTATLAMALEILKSVGKLTTNIALVHKTLELADNLKEYLVSITGISADNFRTFSHETYRQFVNNHVPDQILNNDTGEVTYDKNELVLDPDTKLWHYKNEELLNTEDWKPSMIIIDEVTNISELDLIMYSEFLKKLGIKQLNIGDYFLTSLHGNFAIGSNGIEYLLSTYLLFFSTFGLVHSFRSENKYLTQVCWDLIDRMNTIVSIDFNEDPSYIYGINPINSNYVEDLRGFYGVNATESNQLVSEDFKRLVDLMLNTLPEKELIFILYDLSMKNSSEYTYLQNLQLLHGDKLKFILGTALGKETTYSIVLKSPLNDIDNDSLIQYYQDLYTATSRSVKGTIIVGGNLATRIDVFNPSLKRPSVIRSILTDDIKKKFNELELKILTELTPDSVNSPISLEYTITESVHILGQNDIEKKLEELSGPDDLPIPQQTYSSLQISINNLPDSAEKNKLLEKLKELEKKVIVEESNEIEVEEDESLYIKDLTNGNPNKIKGPLYSFNAYPWGVTYKNEKYIKDSYAERLGLNLSGLSKVFPNDILFNLLNELVKPREAFKRLHELQHLLYTTDLNKISLPNGYKLVLGFSNNKDTETSKITSDNNNASYDITNHRISAFILDDSLHKVAEIPLYTFPNVKSLIESFVKASGANELEIQNKVQQISSAVDAAFHDNNIEPPSELDEYPILKNLFSIFKNNSNITKVIVNDNGPKFIDINNLTSSHVSASFSEIFPETEKITTVEILSKDKSSDGHYNYNPDSKTPLMRLIHSSKLLHNNIYVVGDKVFALEEDYKVDGFGTILAGKAFVLVTRDPNVQNKTLEAGIKMLEENKASLIYVNVPTINTSDPNLDINKSVENLLQAFVENANTITNRLSIYNIAQAVLKSNINTVILPATNIISGIILYILNNHSTDPDSVLKYQLDSGIYKSLQIGDSRKYHWLAKNTSTALLLRLAVHDIISSALNDTTTRDALIQNISSIIADKNLNLPIYFSFPRTGNAINATGQFTYYELKNGLSKDCTVSILIGSQTVPYPIYICGELRTGNRFGDFTFLVSDLFNSSSQPITINPPAPSMPSPTTTATLGSTPSSQQSNAGSSGGQSSNLPATSNTSGIQQATSPTPTATSGGTSLPSILNGNLGGRLLLPLTQEEEKYIQTFNKSDIRKDKLLTLLNILRKIYSPSQKNKRTILDIKVNLNNLTVEEKNSLNNFELLDKLLINSQDLSFILAILTAIKDKNCQ